MYFFRPCFFSGCIIGLISWQKLCVQRYIDLEGLGSSSVMNYSLCFFAWILSSSWAVPRSTINIQHKGRCLPKPLQVLGQPDLKMYTFNVNAACRHTCRCKCLQDQVTCGHLVTFWLPCSRVCCYFRFHVILWKQDWKRYKGRPRLDSWLFPWLPEALEQVVLGQHPCPQGCQWCFSSDLALRNNVDWKLSQKEVSKDKDIPKMAGSLEKTRTDSIRPDSTAQVIAEGNN